FMTNELIGLDGLNRLHRTSGKVAGASPQEQFGCGIRETQSVARELKPIGTYPAPAALLQLGHFPGPFKAQVVTGGLTELPERPAGHHAQPEGCRFARPGEGRKYFLRFNRPTAFFKLVAIEVRVGPILRPNTPGVTGCARTETEERTTAPVVEIVSAGVGGKVEG